MSRSRDSILTSIRDNNKSHLIEDSQLALAHYPENSKGRLPTHANVQSVFLKDSSRKALDMQARH